MGLELAALNFRVISVQQDFHPFPADSPVVATDIRLLSVKGENGRIFVIEDEPDLFRQPQIPAERETGIGREFYAAAENEPVKLKFPILPCQFIPQDIKRKFLIAAPIGFAATFQIARQERIGDIAQ